MGGRGGLESASECLFRGAGCTGGGYFLENATGEVGMDGWFVDGRTEQRRVTLQLVRMQHYVCHRGYRARSQDFAWSDGSGVLPGHRDASLVFVGVCLVGCFVVYGERRQVEGGRGVGFVYHTQSTSFTHGVV